ncbi:MAG: CpsD/CapB family tyrosine-protein kinase [Traorella sp.]
MEIVKVNNSIKKDYEIVEAFKTLRTNLLFYGKHTKKIAITSSEPNDGKSTMVLNLAASMASCGKKVLVIDTDLRKGTLFKRVQHDGPLLGLSSYFSGMAEAKDILYSTDIQNLFLIFSGVQVPNPTELLGSDEFKYLINSFEDFFDYILIDTAPLGRVIDCAVMLPQIDGTLLVVNTQNNSYRAINRVKNQIESLGGKVLGVILNKVDLASNNKYYGQYGKYY